MNILIVLLSVFILFALINGETDKAEIIPEDEVSLNKQWEDYKRLNNKHYDTPEEEQLRRKLFEDNIKNVINKQNSLFNKCNFGFCLGGVEENEADYKTGLNSFTDLSNEEFINRFLGLRLPDDLNASDNASLLNDSTQKRVFKSVSGRQTIPGSFDWREVAGVVTPIKNQDKDDRSCLSCWAFSTCTSLEGQLKIKKNQSVELSPQHLVDCAYQRSGCEPGWTGEAFDFVRDNGGLSKENDYPYTATYGQCRSNISNFDFKVKNYEWVNNDSVDENELMRAVFEHGPIAIAINASPSKLIGYKSGVYFDSSCKADDKREFNHAVNVVGYGTDANGRDYFIIKNSWGKDWGENGYMRIARNRNMCGIGRFSLFPVLE